MYGNFKTKLYSNNISEKIPIDTLNKFMQNKEKKGNNIIGIYIHSVREDNEQRPISQKIKNLIKINPCSSCGTKSDLICDHKNYLYNDEKVLSLRTQKLEDFQKQRTDALDLQHPKKPSPSPEKSYAEKMIGISKSGAHEI